MNPDAPRAIGRFYAGGVDVVVHIAEFFAMDAVSRR